MDTVHPFTLNQFFGTLTLVWVVPLSDTGLTPAPRLPGSTLSVVFGVGQGTEGFLPLNSQSVALLR